MVGVTDREALQGLEDEEYQPTLIIGLGGTGKKVVTRLKTRFLERYGDVPATVRLMCLDIDVQEEKDILGEREVTLLPGSEMVDLGDVPAGDIVQQIKRGRYPELRDWFRPDVPLQEANLRRGGQQNRQLGRLAFFWNLRARNLYRALESPVHYLRQQGLDARRGMPGHGRGGELVVYLVGSLAGGTGSGIAIDTAYVLRYIANSIGILDTTAIVGVFVLPRAFDMVRQEAIQPNALASLQELDYFMTRPREARRFSTIRYIEGSNVTQVDCTEPPFNLCYLIDAVSAKGEMLPSIERLLPMVVDSMYLLAVSKMGTMAWSNVNNLGRKFRGKLVFSSFGVASLVFPAVQIRHVCAARVAREAVVTLLSAPSGAAMAECPRDVERFMAKQPLTYNELMTRLQVAADGRPIMLNLLGDERMSSARLDAIPKEQWYVTVTRQVDELVSTWETAARKRIEENRVSILTQLVDDVALGLKRKVRDLVNSQECGLNYAVRFLDTLEARLRSLETEVERRRSEAEVNKETIKKQRTASANNFDEEVHRSLRFISIGTDPKGARDQYLRDSKTFLDRTLALDAHTNAKSLLASLFERISALRGELNRLAGNLAYVRETYVANKEKTYKREIDTMDTVRRKPITRDQDIDRLYNERRAAAVHDVVQEVLSGNVPQGGEGLYGLVSAEGDTVGDFIYSSALRMMEDIQPIRLESVIEEREKDKGHPVDRSQWLRDLHNNADVFWSYSEAVDASDSDIAAHFVVTGVEDTKSSIYQLAGTQEQSFCSTGDSHRITVLQMKHALNYRSMKQYDEFENNYRIAVKRNYPLHVFPEFAAAGDREKNFFVQGYVYGLITRRGPVFYCEGPDGSPVQLNKADQGLNDALWTFARERKGKLVEHVGKQVEQKLYGATVTDEQRKALYEQAREKSLNLALVGEDADADNQLLATELQTILEAHLNKLERELA